MEGRARIAARTKVIGCNRLGRGGDNGWFAFHGFDHIGGGHKLQVNTWINPEPQNMAGRKGDGFRDRLILDEAAVLGAQIGVDNLSLVDVDLPMLGGDGHVWNENR